MVSSDYGAPTHDRPTDRPDTNRDITERILKVRCARRAGRSSARKLAACAVGSSAKDKEKGTLFRKYLFDLLNATDTILLSALKRAVGKDSA